MKKLVFLMILFFAVSVQAKDLEVVLSWDANTEGDLAGYKLYRSGIPNTDYVEIADVPASQTTYTDTFSVPDGEIQTFYYVGTAYDLTGLESEDLSNMVTALLNGNEPPAQMQNLTIEIRVIAKVDITSDGNITVSMINPETVIK